MRQFTTLIFCLLTTIAFSQSPTQTIRGIVIDVATQAPLVGATIKIKNTTQGTSTDASGLYLLKNVAIGRYSIEVKYLGYETLLISEVLLESSRETVLDIQLQEASAVLDVVEVRATGNNLAAVAPLAGHVISLEETRRFPATFYDPARMAVAFAGVRNTNDQANGVSIRGNSPMTMKWMLEGVDIVNPNHTPNAGTVNDRITTSAGGVNILSSQLLDNSILLKGNFGVEYGNVLGGVMDMRLRKGNNQQREHTLQAGLNGFDISTEGPFSKNSKASYLVNARYSFTGLLALMGVDFGGETIAYQDVSANVSLPSERYGDFTIFGLAGSSQNVFMGEGLDSVLIEKDLKNIDFGSSMYAIGLTHQKVLKNAWLWKTRLAYSATESNRTSATYDAVLFPNAIKNLDNIQQSKLSLHTSLAKRISRRLALRMGIISSVEAYQQTLNFESFTNYEYNLDIDANTSTLQTYAALTYDLTNRMSVDFGLHYLGFSLTEGDYSDTFLALEPRGNISFQINQQSKVTLAVSQHSQANPTYLYLEKSADGSILNENLGLNKAWHFGLAYKHYFKNALAFHAEIYTQRLSNIPENQYIQTFDLQENFRIPRAGALWATTGEVRNAGVDLSLKKYLTNGHYFQLAANLTRPILLNRQRNTIWNTPYAFNAILGKEWEKQKGEKIKSFGLHASIITNAGQPQLAISDESKTLGYTVYERIDKDPVSRLPNYFRIDLRLYRKCSKAGKTNSLALDIQNVTNQQNIAFQYFDYLTEQIESKYQLGLIPVLTWRGEF